MTPKLIGNGPLLLVDDDDEDIRLLRACFVRSQLADRYRLVSYINPAEALDFMGLVEAGAEVMPSIALLDINMPQMNGFQLLKSIRSRRVFSEVPAVVFVTSSDHHADIKQAEVLSAAYQEKFSSIAGGVAFFNRLNPANA